jgi:hypothetical protein
LRSCFTKAGLERKLKMDNCGSDKNKEKEKKEGKKKRRKKKEN